MGIRGKGGLRATGDRLGGAVGNVGDAQLVVAIRTIDSGSEPFAIGRKTAVFAKGHERFPLAVVGGRHGGLGLRMAEECGGKNQDGREDWTSHGWPFLGKSEHANFELISRRTQECDATKVNCG